MKNILIKSKEEETNIVYTFVLSEEDAFRIMGNQNEEHISIENGQVRFIDDKIMIKTIGAGGYLQKDDVIDQIKAQL